MATRVIITVRSGLVHDVRASDKGLEVSVIDYDVQYEDAEDAKRRDILEAECKCLDVVW